MRTRGWRRFSIASGATSIIPRSPANQAPEGAATVSFRVLPDGRLRGLRIKKTSGNAHLDHASLEAVRKAAPLPWLDKTLVLTIRYTLTRTTD